MLFVDCWFGVCRLFVVVPYGLRLSSCFSFLVSHFLVFVSCSLFVVRWLLLVACCLLLFVDGCLLLVVRFNAC